VETRRIFEVLKQTTEANLMSITRLHASKTDREFLGATEFEVRDRVHRIGARALEAARHGRQKGATMAPAEPARTAGRRPGST
jgi:hypothetical protein